MTMVLKTREGSTEGVAIAGVGYLPPDAKGGVLVSDASRVMSEFQEHDDDGAVALDDDGNPVALTGSKLTAAAKKWAEDHDLQAVNVADATADSLAADAGMPVDPQTAQEVGVQIGEYLYGDLETVNDDPTSPDQIEGTPKAGVTAATSAPSPATTTAPASKES